MKYYSAVKRNKLLTTICNVMDESSQHAEQKKTDAEEYTPYHSIYRKLWRRILLLEKAGLIFAEESWHSGCLRGGRQGTAGKEREGLLWDAALVLYVLRGVGHTAVYICTYSLSCTLRVCEFHWGKLEIIQVSHHFKNAISIVSGIPLVRVQLGINVWRTFMLSIKNLEILVLLTQ